MDMSCDQYGISDGSDSMCMFNFMNRIVLGHGGTDGDISPHYQMSADFLAQKGYVAEGAP